MGRQTDKLMRGLDLLGLTFDPKRPNVVIYGRLADMGYSWDGREWHALSPALRNPASVRVMSASRAEVIALTDMLGRALHAKGYTVTVRPPIANRDGHGFRQYFDVE
jgi:hypothetical protein